MYTKSKWLSWESKTPIFLESPESEPTKPPKPPGEDSKPGSVSFGGSPVGQSQKIEAVPDRAKLTLAYGVLGRAGVRFMALEGGVTIGIWSDLDGPKVRAALRAFGSDSLPVRYLDGAGIAARYKLRQQEGEPVPINVLAEMERHPAEPWNVRDQILRFFADGAAKKWPFGPPAVSVQQSAISHLVAGIAVSA